MKFINTLFLALLISSISNNTNADETEKWVEL